MTSDVKHLFLCLLTICVSFGEKNVYSILCPFFIWTVPLMLSCMSCLCWLLTPYFGGSDGKASACNAGDLGSIPGSGRSPRERNGNPLQDSCLENPMDGWAWWARVHRVAKRQTRLSDFSLFAVWSLYNVLLTSAVQRRESAISVHTPLPSGASPTTIPPLSHHGAQSWTPWAI